MRASAQITQSCALRIACLWVGRAVLGGLPGEVPTYRAFADGLPPNPACLFRAPGSPAIYAACATGFAWMYSWHAAQTMRVLRRILAMSAAHAGWPGPGTAELAESGDLVDCHRGAVLAQLAYLLGSR